MKKILMMAALATIFSSSVTSASLITFSSDFSGFTGAGFQSVPTAGQMDSDLWAMTGWSNGNLAFGATQTTVNTDYTRGASAIAVGTGGVYAFSSTPGGTAANPSFGIQPGGSDWAPGTLTLQIANSSIVPLNEFTISYDLYVRNDQDRSNSFNFSYATGLTNTPGTFTSVPSFNFTSGVTAAGTAWSTDTFFSTFTLGTAVAPGSSFFLRWSGADVAGSGSRDEFALDNISFSAVPEPTAMLLVGSVLVIGGYRRKRS